MEFEINDIINDEEIQDFLESKPRRESTQRQHITRLKQYCNFLGKSPTELIEEAENEEEDRIRMKKRHIRKYFKEYSLFLRNKGHSQYSISNQFSSIKTFYLNSEIDLPNIEITSKSEIKKGRIESVPSKKEIRKALNHCKFKYRAIILLMSSSGLGAGELRNLTFGDFLNAISEFLDHEDMDIIRLFEMLDKKENIIGSWNVHRQKQGNRYYTFSSPESIIAIMDYLIERQRKSGIIESKEAPLFENFSKKISESAFNKNFQRINDSAELGYSGRQRYLKSHSMRKYFASTLHKKGLTQINIDWMLGHEIVGVDKAYIQADPLALKEEYLKVVEDLSIAKVKVTKVTTPEYDSLIGELGESKQEVVALKEYVKEQEELHRIEMNEMKVNIDENQSSTEDLILELINNSKTSNLENMKLPSGKQSLEVLGTILKAEKKNE